MSFTRRSKRLVWPGGLLGGLFVSLLVAQLLPSAAQAAPVSGTWFFAGTATPIYFNQDISGNYLGVSYNYFGQFGQGTLTRVGFNSFGGTVFQNNGACTVALYTTITFYSAVNAVSQVRGSNGACGFSPFVQMDVQFYR